MLSKGVSSSNSGSGAYVSLNSTRLTSVRLSHRERIGEREVSGAACGTGLRGNAMLGPYDTTEPAVLLTGEVFLNSMNVTDSAGCLIGLTRGSAPLIAFSLSSIHCEVKVLALLARDFLSITD